MKKVNAIAGRFLDSKDPEILVAASKMIGGLGITDFNDSFARILQQNSSPLVRSAMISALHAKYVQH